MYFFWAEPGLVDLSWAFLNYNQKLEYSTVSDSGADWFTMTLTSRTRVTNGSFCLVSQSSACQLRPIHLAGTRFQERVDTYKVS